MTSPGTVSQARAPRTELTPILDKDLSEVAHFIAAQSGRSAEIVEAHLRWFLLENPVRRLQDPLGFGLRAADQLVGCILCSPQAFHFEDKKILLMGSSSFYVGDGHRGNGGRLFLQYSRLGKQWPLFGTSANAEAAPLWKAAGAHPIPYSDCELFGVLRWPPLVEEVVHRKNPNRMLSRLAGGPVANVAALIRPLKIDYGASDALRPLSSADQANDLRIQSVSAKLTAMRDLSYIRWRYFSGRDATVAVFAFRSHQPRQEVLVTVNQRLRGYRSQINTLNVLDVYPEISPDEWLRVAGALIARYRDVVDAIVLRSPDPQRQKIFCERGFQRRAFDQPNGWFLDKAGLLQTHEWYPVPADGDGLI